MAIVARDYIAAPCIGVDPHQGGTPQSADHTNMFSPEWEVLMQGSQKQIVGRLVWDGPLIVKSRDGRARAAIRWQNENAARPLLACFGVIATATALLWLLGL
jgi:hypothetical protein